MRTKEDAPDYRYFPEPDLVELDLPESFIEEIKESMPELPSEKVKRFIERYGIPRSEVLLLTKKREVAEYFEECARHTKDYKRLSSWIINELFRILKEASIRELPISPKDFASLVNLISDGRITEQIGKEILDEMFKTGKDPESIVKEKDIRVIQEKDLLVDIVDQVIRENSKAVEKIRSGKIEAVNFLVGQVMRKTRGQADAKIVRKMIMERLGYEEEKEDKGSS